MPLYEYECRECGQVFEKMVRFSEIDQPAECPECKSQDIHKRITTFASTGSSSQSAASSGCGGGGGRFT
jgi:putative FmdB family regulatory protein